MHKVQITPLELMNLPEDLLKQILQFLNIKRRHRFCAVSKTWNALIDSIPIPYCFVFRQHSSETKINSIVCRTTELDDGIWYGWPFSTDEVFGEEELSMMALPKLGHKIKAICFSDQPASPEAMIEISRYCDGLEYVDGWTMDDSLNEVAFGIMLFKNMKTLKRLALPNLEKNSFRSYFAGTYFPKLTSLHICVDENHNDEFLLLLTELPEYCPVLETLFLMVELAEFSHRRLYTKILTIAFRERLNRDVKLELVD